jgi:hypothetical protein
MNAKIGKFINKSRAANAIYAFCMLVLFFQQFSTVALALSGEQKDVLKSGSHYFNIAAGCSASSSNATGTGAATGSVIWPFASKSDSQYQRVDQGWDIQDKPGANIYAIAPGTLHKSNADPGGFGNDYPTEELSQSIGGPTNFVYYGHVHVDPSLDGKSVVTGQLIAQANTTDPQNGSAAPTGWLEIGFANSTQGDPHNSGSGPTPAGQKMKDILLNAKPGSGASPNPTPTPDSASCCTSSGDGSTPSGLVGNDHEEQTWNFFKQAGLSDAQVAGIMGNIQQESGFDPEEIEGGGRTKDPSGVGGGWGLIQWTPGYKMPGLLTQSGVKGQVYDLLTQLQLTWQHMHNHPVVTQPFDLNHFKTINDPVTAAEYFGSQIEGFGKAGNRFADAPKFLQKYGGKAVPGATTSTAECNTAGSSAGTCTANGLAYTNVLTQAELEKVFGKADGHTNIVDGTFFGKAVKVNAKVLPCLQAVEKDLKAQNTTYTVREEIPSLRWPADSLSLYHPYGAAVDINPSDNPMCGGFNGGFDPKHLCHGNTASHDIPDSWIKTFEKYGFYWGGNFKNSPDYMHFEWHGEKP